MSDQPDAYYQEWAARLNVAPELIADAERIAGKPIGEMIVEDWDTMLGQMQEDALLLGTAMARHGAENLGELADAMNSDDDDYADLRAALQRAVTILILEKGVG